MKKDKKKSAQTRLIMIPIVLVILALIVVAILQYDSRTRTSATEEAFRVSISEKLTDVRKVSADLLNLRRDYEDLEARYIASNEYLSDISSESISSLPETEFARQHLRAAEQRLLHEDYMKENTVDTGKSITFYTLYNLRQVFSFALPKSVLDEFSLMYDGFSANYGFMRFYLNNRREFSRAEYSSAYSISIELRHMSGENAPAITEGINCDSTTSADGMNQLASYFVSLYPEDVKIEDPCSYIEVSEPLVYSSLSELSNIPVVRAYTFTFTPSDPMMKIKVPYLPAVIRREIDEENPTAASEMTSVVMRPILSGVTDVYSFEYDPEGIAALAEEQIQLLHDEFIDTVELELSCGYAFCY